MKRNENEQKNAENTAESLKNQLIYGIIKLSKEERAELLALWKKERYNEPN